MDYLADRVRKLEEEASGVPWNAKQSDLVSRMIGILGDMAVITDDLADAVSELDTRLLELEEKMNGDGPD